MSVKGIKASLNTNPRSSDSSSLTRRRNTIMLDFRRITIRGELSLRCQTSQGFRACTVAELFLTSVEYRRCGGNPVFRVDGWTRGSVTGNFSLSRNANCVRDGVEIIHDWCSHSRARMSEAKLWDEGRVMIRFWSKDGDGVTKVNALTFAGSLAWGQIDVSATMPALPLVAVKKVGAVPDAWILAASGLFTVTDPVDDAITANIAHPGLTIRSELHSI